MKLLRPALSKASALGRASSADPSKSNIHRWAWVGALAGAIFSFGWNLPAQWLARGLAEASKGQIQLQEAQGSVWKGSGKLVLTGGDGSRDALALPGRVLWTMGLGLNAANLPSVNVSLQASCCMPQPAQLHVAPLHTLNTWQVQIDNHRSEWPAQWLSGLGAPWNTMQPEGSLVLETQQLMVQWTQQQTRIVGSLSLTANNLSSRLSTLKPMGTYQLSLASDPANAALPKLNLITQSGSLLLSGQGQWQGSKFQFRGEASAVPEHAAALSNLLNIIGRRQGARSLLSLG